MSNAGVNVYEVSRALYDLKNAANREACRADCEAFFRGYEAGEEGRGLLVRRDWRGLIEAGVSIYLITKLAAVSGVDLIEVGAAIRGVKREELMGFIKEQNERNRGYAVLFE